MLWVLAVNSEMIVSGSLVCIISGSPAPHSTLGLAWFLGTILGLDVIKVSICCLGYYTFGNERFSETSCAFKILIITNLLSNRKGFIVFWQFLVFLLVFRDLRVHQEKPVHLDHLAREWVCAIKTHFTTVSVCLLLAVIQDWSDEWVVFKSNVLQWTSVKCFSPFFSQMKGACICWQWTPALFFQQTGIPLCLALQQLLLNNLILGVKQERFILIKTRLGKTKWEI